MLILFLRRLLDLIHASGQRVTLVSNGPIPQSRSRCYKSILTSRCKIDTEGRQIRSKERMSLALGDPINMKTVTYVFNSIHI